jgi:uncharacterized protein (UPF0332 family)
VALNEQQYARLALAQGLRQRADHSSESELRDALSRSYYSLFHVGLVLLGREWIRHENLPKELESIDRDLARTVGELSKLRESADYDPNMLTRDFSGDLELFRLKASGALERGRTAYQRLLDEIRKKVA